MQILKEYLDRNLDCCNKGENKGKYLCPCCGHYHLSYVQQYDKVRCFTVSCKLNNDSMFSIIDVIRETENISFAAAKEKAEKLGYSLEHRNTTDKTSFSSTDSKSIDKEKASWIIQEGEKHLEEILKFGTEYRGISKKVLKRHHIGYNSKYNSIIIPQQAGGIKYRNLDKGKPKYVFMQGSKSGLFVTSNNVFNSVAPAFIVEGEFDAMSLEEVGAAAIGLGSTENRKKLIEIIKKCKDDVKKPIIYLCDNDEPGRKAGQDFKEALKGIVDVYSLDIFKYYDVKDANEFLQKDRKAFTEEIKYLIEQDKKELESLESSSESERKDKLAKYDAKHNALYIFDSFLNDIESIETKYTSTGFKEFDNVLGGGLTEGLYVLGALSSLGKTTLMLQIADNIAEKSNINNIAGKGEDITDVLIFNLEMSSKELIAKSLSRMTYKRALSRGHNKEMFKYAYTTRDITSKDRQALFGDIKKDIYEKSLMDYGNIANYIYSFEGVGDIKAADIRKRVQEHIELTKHKVVVFVDYLQILGEYDERLTDKKNIDKNVLELKRISRDFKIPVFVVSSLNRASYNNKSAMESFNGSGAIEYSADVLVQLGFKAMEEEEYTDINELKRKENRDIVLTILKNRNGRTGDKINYSFTAAFNYFSEESIEEKNISSGKGLKF